MYVNGGVGGGMFGNYDLSLGMIGDFSAISKMLKRFLFSIWLTITLHHNQELSGYID